MIISKNVGLSFYHIPKCAGTHLKKSLGKLNEFSLFESGVINHPLIGDIDSAHIPLAVLNRYFPEEYEAFSGCYSFAIIREPISRFFSAMSQYSKAHRNRAIKDLSFEELKEDLDFVLDWLEANGDKEFYPPELIYFMPQSRFISENEVIKVNELFTTRNIERVYDILKNKFGVDSLVTTVDTSSNVTVAYKSNFIKILFGMFSVRLRANVKKIIPNSLLTFIGGLIYTKPKSCYFESICNTKNLQFLDVFYKDDIALYESLNDNL